MNLVNKIVKDEEELQVRLAEIAAKTERDKYKWEARRERYQAVIPIVLGFFALILIIGVAYLAWLGTRGLNSDQELERDARRECAKIEGTFISSGDMCLAPSHKVAE